MRGVKIMWGSNIYLLHFHYFISLETANAQESEVFLLRISSGTLMHQELFLANIIKLTEKIL